MAHERALLPRGGTHKVSLKIHEIEPELLHNPTESEDLSTYIGWGSFGVVCIQIYRGIKVAVKELLPRSVVADVRHEAEILALFCHPYLPLLFGVSTSTQPYRIVMQCHGFREKGTSVTLQNALSSPGEVHNEEVMVMLCIQFMEAIRYLHDDAKVLHNDLKCNNILVCDSVAEPPALSSTETCVQILIIDFGKATSIENGKHYRLSEIEKAEYIRCYSHISPEVIEGLLRQTTMSDMYAVGGILQRVVSSGILTTYEIRMAIDNLATKCRSPKYLSRPPAHKVLGSLQLIM